MLWRMLRQSWGRNLRRKVLAIITVFLASSLISALLAVSIDIGDKQHCRVCADARRRSQRGGRTSADSGHFLQSASGYS